MSNQLARTRQNLPVRLFRGDVSLPVTYWVFSVLIGGVFLGIVLGVIEFNYAKIAMTEYGPWLVQAFYWFAIAYTVFMFIAIWRSAGKYRGWALWKWLARIVVLLGVLFLIANFIIGLEQGSDSDMALREEIRLMNQSLPTMVDDVTRLDHVLLKDRTMYYNYTLITKSAGTTDIQRFKTIMAAQLKISTCEESGTRAFLNEEGTLVYMYRDKKGGPVAKISVTKSDCL